MSESIIAGKKSDELIDYLLKRRSVPIKNLTEPGPDAEQIKKILQAASRAPDHNKLFPWYFMVFDGERRREIGEVLSWSYRDEDRAAAPAKLQLESERFLRAPLVIGVISRIRKGKAPAWEQILSAGAVCQNLCLAANALGFGTNWVTEWYAYNKMFRDELGLDERDHIAGFIYIGTPAEPPEERDRPDLDTITTYWEPGIKNRRGDQYDREGQTLPMKGFDLSKLP